MKPTPALGVRTRWWWGDVDHLIARLREDGRTPTSVGRAVQAFIGGGKAAQNEVFRLDDWKPALRESIDWLRRR